jgi:hypothetical protein
MQMTDNLKTLEKFSILKTDVFELKKNSVF